MSSKFGRGCFFLLWNLKAYPKDIKDASNNTTTMVNKERKAQYFNKLRELLDNHTSCFIVHADHVRSKQFADVGYTLTSRQ